MKTPFHSAYTALRASSLLLLVCSLWMSAAAVAQERGVKGQSAKSWEADKWIQLPEGKKSLNPADFKGKVVYLYCFQSWCPGCHKYGFPTLKALEAKYRGNNDVAFVAVQTVFEGFSSNPPERAKEMAEKYDLNIPFGHSGLDSKPSVLMRNYRTGGTPWTIVIDREGIVRYNDFHIAEKDGSKLIDQLLKAKS